jgi:hypothetical protein
MISEKSDNTISKANPPMVGLKCWASVLCLITMPLSGFSQVVMQGVTLQGHVTTSGQNITGTWSDRPRRATLTFGIKGKDELRKDRFLTGGAGILVEDSAGRHFIATALHVFENPAQNWAPDSLQVRCWRDEQKSRYEEFGYTLQLRKDGQPLYRGSKTLDLAVIPAPQELLDRVADDQHHAIVAGPEDLGGSEDIYDGADVFILGFPGLVGDQYQQRAFMRFGIIAWTNSTGPADHEFLVDARIFPGNSGGPVFSSAAGITRDGGLASGKQIRLLGIVSQTINAKPELALGIHLPAEAMVVGAAGAGVIEPAHALIELMAQVP